MTSADFLTSVRVAVFEEWVRTGRAPTAIDLAERLGVAVPEIRGAWEQLALGRALVLQPESRDLMMANPLSAVPTSYRVVTPRQSYFSPCIWDGLGALAMLGSDGTVDTSCPCCGEAMTVEVSGGRPFSQRGIVHFPIPAKQWWDDIVFT